MKKLVLLTGICIVCVMGFAQSNVGIGTNSPVSKLDVSGALSLREGAALSLANGGASGGANDNIVLPYITSTTDLASFYRITGPTAVFSVYGIVPETGSNGQLVTLINTTGKVMTLVNNGSSATTNDIATQTGANLVDNGNSSVTLQYNKSVSKWYVTATQNFVVSNAQIGNSAITVTAGTGLTGGGTVALGGSTTIGLTVPVVVSNGGTGLTSLTANNLIYGNGTGAASLLAPSTTTGTLLMNTNAGAPSWSTLNSLPSTSGVLPVANGGTGSATQGWVDLTTNQTAAGNKTWSGISTFSNTTASTTTGTGAVVVSGGEGIGGNINVGGTETVAGLATLNGGVTETGAATINTSGSATTNIGTSSNTGAVAIGNTTGGVSIKSLTTAGIVTTNASGLLSSVATLPNTDLTNSSITISPGTGMSGGGTVALGGTVTLNNTGVTSVGMAMPGIFSVSGSPVTTTGTLTAALANESANTVFAGPASGSAAAPAFRALVAADIPASSGNYIQNQTSATQSAAFQINGIGIFNSASTSSSTNGNLQLGCTGGNCWTANNPNGIIGFVGYGTAHGQLAFYPNYNTFAFVNSSCCTPSADMGALTSSLSFDNLWAGGAYFSGSVGIGTTGPLGNLDVEATTANTWGHLVVNRSNSGAVGGELSINNNAGGNGAQAVLAFGTDGSTNFDGSGNNQDNAEIRAINDNGTTNATDLRFSNWSGSAENVNMVITSAGYVGVGNSAPGYMFDVAGKTDIDGANDGAIYMTGTKNTYHGIEWNYASNDRYGMAQATGGNTAIYTSAAYSPSFISFDLANAYTSAYTELMRITHTGDVGIGTTAPFGSLDVNLGNIYVSTHNSTNEHSSSNQMSLRMGMQTGSCCGDGFAGMQLTTEPFSCGNGGIVQFYTWGCNVSTAREVARINEYGYLGISTTNPGYPIDIETTSNDPNSISYWRACGPGCANEDVSAAPTSVSLYTSGRIVTGNEIDIQSDKRIKDVVDFSSGAEDLATLNRIQVTDFKYKDKVEYGNRTKKGFIAQQLEGAFPEAITYINNFIPNIYANAESAYLDPSTHALTVIMAQPHNLVKGDKLRIIEGSTKREAVVDTVISDVAFKVSDWDGTADQLFVYGKQVKDFHVVDYDRVYTLNVSATQELARQLADAKCEIEQLKNDNSRLQQITETTDNKYNQLKAQVDALQQLMEKNGIRSEK